MFAATLALSRPPCFANKWSVNNIQNDIHRGLHLALSESAEIRLINFLAEAGWMSVTEIREAFQEGGITLHQKAIAAITDCMMAEWSKVCQKNGDTPNWSVRFVENAGVNSNELGLAVFTDTPFCWHLNYDKLAESYQPLIISLAEHINKMMTGITSLSMTGYGDFMSSVIDDLATIDELIGLELMAQKLDEIEQMENIYALPEYLMYHEGEEVSDILRYLTSMYNEIKLTKAMVENDLSKLKGEMDALGVRSLFEPILIALSENRISPIHSTIEALSEETLDDEMYVHDLSLSLMTFYGLDYDTEFEQNIQVEWENGATFGGVLPISEHCAKEIKAWFGQLAIGIGAMSQLESIVYDLTKMGA